MVANARPLLFLNDETRERYDAGAPAPASTPTDHFTMLTDTEIDRCLALGPLAAVVYLYLARRSNAQGQCWPSYKDIADGVRISRRQVVRLVSALRHAELVTTETRTDVEGDPTSNLFTLPLRVPSGVVTEMHQGWCTTVTSAPQSPKVNTEQQEQSETSVKSETTDVPAKPAKQKKQGSRIDQMFRPTDENVAWASRSVSEKGLGLPSDFVESEIERFTDYWLGVGKPMVSWDYTWRNWMRKEARTWNERQQRKPAYQTKEDKRQQALDYFMQRAQETP